MGRKAKKVNVYRNGRLVASYPDIQTTALNVDRAVASVRNCIYGLSINSDGYEFEYADGSGRVNDDEIERRKQTHRDWRNNYYKKFKK